MKLVVNTLSFFVLSITVGLGQVIPMGFSTSVNNPSCGNGVGVVRFQCNNCTISIWQEGIYDVQNNNFIVEQTYNSGATNLSLLNYSIPAPGKKSYRVWYSYNDGSFSGYSQPYTVEALVAPVGGSLTSTTTSLLNGGSGQLILAGANGARTWLQNDQPVTLNDGNFNITETAKFQAKLSNGPCVALSNPLTVKVYKTGVLLGSSVSNDAYKVWLLVADSEGTVLQFEYSVDGGVTWIPFNYYYDNPEVTGDRIVDNHEIWTDTKFRALIDLGPFGAAYTNTVDVDYVEYSQSYADPTNGRNFVREQEVIVKGISNSNLVDNLTATQKHEVITYLDGKGRPVQTNLRKASPTQQDIVSAGMYDRQGRLPMQYLPYVASQNSGAYRPDPFSEQAGFYLNGIEDKLADDPYPFSKTVFEKSPLGRVTEQGNVGQHFQPGSGHSVSVSYSNNEADEIRLIRSDGTSTGFYSANELSNVETTDPDGKRQQTFKDKSGRIVVSRVQLDENVTINGSTIFVPWLETYYIYNELGSIKFIISPKGVQALKSGGWVLTSSIKEQYVHEFVYDSRARLVEKKVPGQDWLFYCHDRFDRLVLTQDGFLRSQSKWMFVKYDRRGRPVKQGLYTNTTNTSRLSMQEVVDALYASESDRYFEAGPDSNFSFPIDNTQDLVKNYYDYYTTDYSPQGLPGEGTLGSSHGLLTATWRLILGTNTWLVSNHFYDEKGRLIQVKSNNQFQMPYSDITTIVYDFEGKTKIKKVHHDAGAGRITTVVNKFEYDHASRLINVYQNNNNASADQLVARYEYNALGQLVDKKLHSTGATDFLQSVDYRYSIQGWLTSINNAQLDANGVSNDDTNDYFGMEFLYEKTEPGLLSSADVNYNGNVSAVKWKGVGTSSGAQDQHAYRFGYDKSNRMLSASSAMFGGMNWNKEAGAFNESLAYDLNGNILSLQRNQRQHTFTVANRKPVVSFAPETVDDLTYVYSATQGDQLLNVTDATGKAAGFDNGTSGTAGDFTYDNNGNLLSDQNKGITSDITYNHLGKPTEILFADGRKVEYVYDALGNKLTMRSYGTGGFLLSTTDYVDGFVYENGGLDFFGMPEGRVSNAASILNRMANAACSSTVGFPANQDVTVSAVEIEGNDYVRAICNQNSSILGVYPINGNLSVTPGESYLLRVRGYATSPNCHLYVNTDAGDLVWPGVALPVGASNEASVSVRFIVPAGVTTVRVGVLWTGPVAGQEMYLNHVELRKLELEYQYAIADHQGNTRVVFSSVTPEPDAPKATFEDDVADGASEYKVDPATVRTFTAANHTPGGSKVVRMNQNYPVGPSRSLKVSPGDKVDMEVWTYFEGSSGWSNSNTGVTAFIASVAGAFGGLSTGAGESGLIYNGVNTAYSAIGMAGNQGDEMPSAYLNYILFDQNYKLMDMGWEAVTASANMSKQKISISTVNVKEAGYMFVYLSYEGESANWVYFDDFLVTHTKTNVIQYNEYYPFGLSTTRSWTRENAKNDFLYNAGSERNATTGWYETHFRNYDPVLGRFMSVDPLATKYSSYSGYHYSFNSPVLFNDPLGAESGPSGPSLPETFPGPSGYTDGNGNFHWYDQTGDGQSYAHLGMGHLYSEYQQIARQFDISAARAGDRNALGRVTEDLGGSITSVSHIWNPWGGEYRGEDSYKGIWMSINDPEAWTFVKNKGIHDVKTLQGGTDGSNWATATLAFIAADLAIPEPTDAAWPKWAGYAVAGTVAAVYLANNNSNNNFFYVTYIKINPTTGQVYVGRSSGYGDPYSVVRARDSNHHMKGYGPAVLSSSARALVPGGYSTRALDPSYWYIRGSEQVQIQYYRHLGISGNSINGIGPNNPNIKKYLDEFTKFKF